MSLQPHPPSDNANLPRTRWMVGLVLLGALAYPAWQQLSPRLGGTSLSGAAGARSPMKTRDAAEVAAPHLAWAEAECEKALDESIASLKPFFDGARGNLPAFATDALGFRSKFNLVTDVFRGEAGKRHPQYLRDRFEKHIFSGYQLEMATRQVVKTYLQRVRAIEGEMLVRIRIDAEDLPHDVHVATRTESDWQNAFDRTISQAKSAAGGSFQVDVSRELVSLIAGEVLAQVAVRLGASGGILATGAGASWATFGVGLVVALIVDQIVTWVWDWTNDPKGALVADLKGKLDEIERTLVEGHGESPGLRARLQSLAKERAELRKRTVLDLLTR